MLHVTTSLYIHTFTSMTERFSTSTEPSFENKESTETAHLEPPSVKYKDTFIEALKEFHKEGKYTYLDVEELETDFDAFLKKIPEIRKAMNNVPESEFWLVDNDQYIGRLSIRHELNEELLLHGGHIGYAIRPSERKKGYATKALEQGLIEAHNLGLTRVLLTCDSTNVASRKIIEKHGGTLENEVDGRPGDPSILRFWIDIM